jgi:pyruvate/2-oxoglutarate dehydrogenase complex dihydrolipoamide acyltransferase (E2) component
MDSLNPSTYAIRPNNKFFQANRAIVEYEIRPGNTVSFFSEVDLTQVERIRRGAVERRPSYTAFVAKAVALALKEFPYANRRICRRILLPTFAPRLQQFHTCDVAVACERAIPGAEGVAFVDILRDVDRLSLETITSWLHRLSTADEETNEQWRSFRNIINRLPSWLSKLLIRLPYFAPGCWVKYRGGAVLISSPAKYGVDGVIAAWSWPLGISFGLVKERPVVRDGAIVACPTFFFSLNFDRRIMAGAQGAHFFKRLVSMIENAETELASADSLQPAIATSNHAT